MNKLHEAPFILGEIYYQKAQDGFCDVAEAYAEALEWFRLAADSGHINTDQSAQLYIACMYENGNGVAKDEIEAMRWYRLAAAQGNAEAREKLNKLEETI